MHVTGISSFKIKAINTLSINRSHQKYPLRVVLVVFASPKQTLFWIWTERCYKYSLMCRLITKLLTISVSNIKKQILSHFPKAVRVHVLVYSGSSNIRKSSVFNQCCNLLTSKRITGYLAFSLVLCDRRKIP